MQKMEQKEQNWELILNEYKKFRPHLYLNT